MELRILLTLHGHTTRVQLESVALLGDGKIKHKPKHNEVKTSTHPCRSARVEQGQWGFEENLPKYLPNLLSQPKLKPVAMLPKPTGPSSKRTLLHKTFTFAEPIPRESEAHPCRTARVVEEFEGRLTTHNPRTDSPKHQRRTAFYKTININIQARKKKGQLELHFCLDRRFLSGQNCGFFSL
ncbi:unnamed protein product [Prunus armeniaca]